MSFLSRQCISLSIQFFTDTPLVFLFVFLYLYTLSFILLLTAVDCCGTPWTLCFGSPCCGRQRFYGLLWKYSLWNVSFLRHSRPRFFPAFFSFLFLYHTSPTLLLLPSAVELFAVEDFSSAAAPVSGITTFHSCPQQTTQTLSMNYRLFPPKPSTAGQ